MHFISGRILYNSGRVVTYAVLGAVFGLLGSGIKLTGLQQYLSVTAGIIIILTVILSTLHLTGKFSGGIISRYTAVIKKPLTRLYKEKTLSSLFLIGIINGLLPCGFVYIGVAGAVTTGSIPEGMLFMALFGLGTFPVMLGTSLFGNFIKNKFRYSVTRLLPALSVVLAVILILRGLNLGIPYVSPKFQEKEQKTEQLICK